MISAGAAARSQSVRLVEPPRTRLKADACTGPDRRQIIVQLNLSASVVPGCPELERDGERVDVQSARARIEYRAMVIANIGFVFMPEYSVLPASVKPPACRSGGRTDY